MLIIIIPSMIDTVTGLLLITVSFSLTLIDDNYYCFMPNYSDKNCPGIMDTFLVKSSAY